MRSTWVKVPGKTGASASTFTKDECDRTMKRPKEPFLHNICGTYVHGIFDKEEASTWSGSCQLEIRRGLMYLRWKV